MSKEKALYMFACMGFELNRLAFKDMHDAGLLNEAGEKQYDDVKNITFDMVKPELQQQSIEAMRPVLDAICEELAGGEE